MEREFCYIELLFVVFLASAAHIYIYIKIDLSAVLGTHGSHGREAGVLLLYAPALPDIVQYFYTGRHLRKYIRCRCCHSCFLRAATPTVFLHPVMQSTVPGGE